MVKYALHVLQVSYLTLEQSHVQTAKINKNIFPTLMNASNCTENLTMIQVKTGLHKMVIANQLIIN